MGTLHDKVAIVTGASAPRGIGRAIATRLAREGASVVLTDIAGQVELDGVSHSRMDLLGRAVADIEDLGVRALGVEVDVSRQADVTACVEAATSAFGGVDILVNNAGSLAGAADFLTTTPGEWTTSFQVNLLGPMMFILAVLPGMETRGGGSIINIGSTGSLGAEPGFGAYTAMKHGLIGLTKTVAAEFGPIGVRCNAVCPGYILTDMHDAANHRLAAENAIPVAEMMARRYANVALRSVGQPQDVADAVAYLAGPQARYVTGVALPVAGGVPAGI